MLVGNNVNNTWRLHWFLYLMPVMFIAAMIQLFVPYLVHASNTDWFAQPVNVERPGNLSANPDMYGLYGSCTTDTVHLQTSQLLFQPIESCVFQAKTFSYTFYEGRLFFSAGESGLMYPLLDYGFASYSNVLPSPMTDDLIFGSVYFKNLPDSVEWNGDALRPAFKPGPSTSILLSYDARGTYRSTGSQAVSKNGRWMVVDFHGLGYVRFDTSDMSVKWVARSENISKHLAINNDGVVMASINYRGYNVAGIFNDTRCGEGANALLPEWFADPPADGCSFKSFSDEINNKFSSATYESLSKPEFSEDGLSLTMFVRPDNNVGEGIIVTIADGVTATKLDYLALGDSYSSGEGDLGIDSEGWPYYTYQSRGQGGCHISTRSYPFLLKQFY